jgi:serine/threonine protein kinase
MTKLGELYTDFFRIDLDAPGGYARVADVVARQADGTPVHRAFKLMRHELSESFGKQGGLQRVGLQRFENELKILVGITQDKTAPSAITRIYDSGFVEAELSEGLHKLQHKDEKFDPIPSLEIVSTGTDIQKFLDAKSALMEKEPERWLPYLVVDLAPYDDSLTRQIKSLSAGNSLNLYVLPVNTIVEMALQLLDVMDYLHKVLRVAYIDWKPEHIYWNEGSKRLNLIDWNVTSRLIGGLGEKQTIREDIRMFSGAALYCSLALTDPEELTKPIGPTPIVPKDKALVISPRYWTDKPNFYQREQVLDESIKQLVQKALDPNQGFNSPQELKNALFQYVAQSDKQGGRDLVKGLPFDAVQSYRRARSYIAAKDYVYANYHLEVAIAIANQIGMSYPDAEILLENVQFSLIMDDNDKQELSLALEKEQWGTVWDICNKILLRHPEENKRIKKLLNGLDSLMRANLLLDSLSRQSNGEKKQTDELEKIGDLLETVQESNILSKAKLLKKSYRRYNQFQGERSNMNIVARLGRLAAILLIALLILGVTVLFVINSNR